jgi:hypothetical protein
VLCRIIHHQTTIILSVERFPVKRYVLRPEELGRRKIRVKQSTELWVRYQDPAPLQDTKLYLLCSREQICWRGKGKGIVGTVERIRILTTRFVFFSQQPLTVYSLFVLFHRISTCFCPLSGISVVTVNTPDRILLSLNDKWSTFLRTTSVTSSNF